MTDSNISDFLAAIERVGALAPATDPPGRMDTVPPKYVKLAGMPVIPASLRQLYETASESAASAARLFALVADEDVDMLGMSVADND